MCFIFQIPKNQPLSYSNHGHEQTPPSNSVIEILAFQRNAYHFPGFTLLSSGDNYGLAMASVGSWHSIWEAGIGERMLESAKVADSSGSAGRLSVSAWAVWGVRCWMVRGGRSV